jgi:membrane-associated protein
VFHRDDVWYLNRKHLERTRLFYEKHGGKAVILCRFAPILRTFSPFVAGIGRMDYRRFLLFDISGGLAWIGSFTLGGYFFGNIPLVKQNFSLVIVAIIAISLMPAAIEFLRARRGDPPGAAGPPPCRAG